MYISTLLLHECRRIVEWVNGQNCSLMVARICQYCGDCYLSTHAKDLKDQGGLIAILCRVSTEAGSISSTGRRVYIMSALVS
jgi:hypothetical protein